MTICRGTFQKSTNQIAKATVTVRKLLEKKGKATMQTVCFDHWPLEEYSAN